MTLAVVDARTRTPIQEDYLVYLPGWTLERYLQEAPENAFWEFVHGEVVVHSPVRAEHQLLVQWLLGVLRGFCLQHPEVCGPILTGPAGLWVAPGVIREPDIFVLAPEDADKARGFPVKARPRLVVEVVSPSTRRLDLDIKPQEYAQARIPEYWVVDEETRTLVQHWLEGEGYRKAVFSEGRMVSRALQGFWLEASWLWQRPRPSEWDLVRTILASEA